MSLYLPRGSANKNLAGNGLRLIQMRVATRRLEKSRQYVKSIRCKRASLIQPQQMQSAFHDVHNETLSAAPDVDPQVRNSFRRLHNKLKMRRTAPMWRNGRRNGR